MRIKIRHLKSKNSQFDLKPSVTSSQLSLLYVIVASVDYSTDDYIDHIY